MEAISERTLADGRRRTVNPAALEEMRAEIAVSKSTEQAAPSLYVLARSLEQLDAVLAWQPESPLARPAMVYCDFEDVRRYREAVEKAKVKYSLILADQTVHRYLYFLRKAAKTGQRSHHPFKTPGHKCHAHHKYACSKGKNFLKTRNS